MFDDANTGELNGRVLSGVSAGTTSTEPVWQVQTGDCEVTHSVSELEVEVILGLVGRFAASLQT